MTEESSRIAYCLVDKMDAVGGRNCSDMCFHERLSPSYSVFAAAKIPVSKSTCAVHYRSQRAYGAH